MWITYPLTHSSPGESQLYIFEDNEAVINKDYQRTKSNDETCVGLFQDSDFAGDLEDSKSTSGGTLCIFGSHTFVPISWMCKKQTAVSHSSTESEIISLDAGLRLDVSPHLIYGI